MELATMFMPDDPYQEPPVDVTALIRNFNASNEAVQDLYTRARRVADAATRSSQAADLATITAETAKIAYQTIKAEDPQRRAPLPRQRCYAALTVALDGVACYFAAQALGGSQDTTLVWTVLFLAILATGEVALDFYQDRDLRAWRTVLAVLSIFIAGLGALRFWFLVVIGTDGLIPAALGAGLFTAVTAGFLFVGYRALRMAETPQAFRARRWARSTAQTMQAARTNAERDRRDRDRLIDAYIAQVRRPILDLCTDVQVPVVENGVRRHLLGGDQA
jgi:hypothetical protein